ncbi:hypothetical protein NE236_03850 [Actinoallomurus purpureus]|uniref:hypothetical protein n=1 Tax=Actinoallomurus purpureus TaxID=478114 RepID=UPI0020928CDA|nr:hypothetical protein [Actinoallomurus purpureus]MCO6004104.1 hypothetical protein [Actinoallomurus purpureus]
MGAHVWWPVPPQGSVSACAVAAADESHAPAGPATRQRLPADETFPDSFVDVLLDGYAAMLAGPPPVLTSTVEGITGVPPRSLRQWAADHGVRVGTEQKTGAAVKSFDGQ